MLFTRNKRFDANKELLRKTTEENRGKRGLYGPQTTAALQKYTEEVQELLGELKRVEVSELWNLLVGKSDQTERVAEIMSCHFMILQEINKQRERAKNFNATPGDNTSSIDN